MDESDTRSFLKLSADFLIIFLPSVGYVFQAIKFQKTKSSKGFSKSLCLMLLLANILRIYFWIGKPFEKSLLFQSIVVIISQIYLIHYYLKYQEKPKDKNEMPQEKSILNHLISWRDIFTPSKLWNWDYEIDYYKFVFLFFSLMSIICAIIGKDMVKFYDVIGTISVGIETFIEIPQIKENCVTKNVKNLSGAMVLMWFIGDLFKTVYNIVNKSPIQMIIGGLIQNCEDIILSTQVLFYSEDGCVAKILKKKFKNYGIDNYHDIDAHNKRKRDDDKIDFEMDGFSRDKMGELKINNNKKDNDMITVEDDEININTDIGK
jgi:uncharacterized protein with PQ loop repeat